MTMAKTVAIRGVAVGAILALMGCDQIGNPLDLMQRPPPPDEFQVIARKPLRMPSSLELPEPRLGAPSPLEPDPNADAVAALYGSVTPTTPAGAPDATALAAAAASTGPATPSVGEQALLSATGTTARVAEIRPILDEEQDRGVSAEPYEPPSVAELLGLSDDSVKDALDPAAESRRIQSEGIARAPVDPDDKGDVVRRDEEEAETNTQLYPVVGARGVPQNTLPRREDTPPSE